MSDLLEVENVSVTYSPRSLLSKKTQPESVVRDISFSVRAGETVGMVGESGSGKTTIGRSILNLVPVQRGEIRFGGARISDLPERKFRPYRKRIQMIFQDPYGSLNTRWTVYQIVSEALDIYFPELDQRQREKRVAELLAMVGLQPEQMRRYPHEFSGGQRQRIGIARALAVRPELIVCDEVVSALDVSVQAQTINLLQDLQDDLGLAYLFISHDLAVVEHVSDQIVVLYRGDMVEKGPSRAVCENPQHPYTQKLLASVPRLG